MNQKGFSPVFILLGIILISSIAGGSYYFGKSQAYKPRPQNPVITPQTYKAPQSPVTPQTTPNSSPIPSPTPDGTINWLKLSNNSCNLSLLYPPTWIVKINKEGTNKSVGIVWDGCVIQVKNINGEPEYILVTSMAPTKTWQETQESLIKGMENLNAKGFKQKISQMKINGQEYAALIDETIPQLTQLGGYFRNADQFFSMIGYYIPNTESQKNFYKILESIKFNSKY